MFLCSAGVTRAGTIAQWCEDASREARRANFLESGKDSSEHLFAIVCSEETEIARRYADYCAVLQRALAARITSKRVRVVLPRGDFSNVDTWDHVSCGDADATAGLGWEAIELRATRKRKKQITFVAERGRDGKELKRGPLAIAELRTSALEAERDRKIARVSSGPEQVGAAASCLAWSLICDLKQLPDKHRIEDVRIDASPASPAESAWLRDVGESVVDHINRVISSSFYLSEPHVLKLSVVGRREDETQPAATACNIGSKLVTARVSAPGGQRVHRGDLHDEREPSAREDSVQRPDRPGATNSAAAPHGVDVGAVEPGDLQEEIKTLGRFLGVSEAVIFRCYKIVDRPERERNAFVRLLRLYNPLSPGANALQVWREWYRFADPNHEPTFPGSPVNAFVEEVAYLVYTTLE